MVPRAPVHFFSVSPIVNILHYYGTFVMTKGPTLAYCFYFIVVFPSLVF